MAGCLDNFQFFKPEWLELGEKRNAVASITAGTLFFLGWWIIIDVASRYPDFNSSFHICGVFGTFSLIMINAVSLSQLRGESFTGGFLGQRGIRIWVFVGFVLGFSSIIAGTWILFASYIIPDKNFKYPGIGLFLQNILIFISSIIFKFGRTEELWS